MVDTYKRSIAKAISWRVFATVVTGLVAFVVTEKIEYAATIGLADSLVKVGAYVLHERIWNRIPFGRAKEPEYQI